MKSVIKKPLTLKTRLIILMALLVLLQSLALVLSLFFSNVFPMLDAEAFRLLNNTTYTRMQSFNNQAGKIVGNLAVEVKALNRQLDTLATEAQISPNLLVKNDDLYIQTALKASDTLMRLLQQNNITGAFMLLEGSNSHKQDPGSHSAIYVRNPSPTGGGINTRDYLLEVGPTAVLQHHPMSTGSRWQLDLALDTTADFYHQPFKAAEQLHNAEIERYGYWSNPGDILKDNQPVVCYTMPLLTSSGKAYGVLGIEISLAYFTQQYLPNSDLPYQNSFYAIAPMQNGELDLEQHIPSGPLAQVYLNQSKQQQLALKPMDETALHSTHLEGLGAVYCSTQPLKLYSDNSPFMEDNWVLLGFVPKSILHQGSSQVRQMLILSILLTTVVACGGVLLLSHISTRKISGLSHYINSLLPSQRPHFPPTGMREVDELTLALTQLNQRVVNATAATSTILGMTQLPVGGYKISHRRNTIVITEYICRLLDIESGTQMNLAEWRKYYAQLTQDPYPGQEDIYQYKHPKTNQPLGLRIKETATPTGLVGVVLDVTQELEEKSRLMHELDYDALTQLYNRTAFQREVTASIMAQPDKLGAMIFTDLDNLKYINDTFGHDTGDRLIIQAGKMFRQFNFHQGLVARISGDEFAIYLHGFTTKDEIRDIIKRQFNYSKASYLPLPTGSKQRIRFSAGIAWYPTNADNVADLLRQADYAMYEAKHNEKGMTYEFDPESYQKNVYLLENREIINKLLEEQLIRFAYQPIVDLRTGKIHGYEALMRPLLADFRSPLEILSVASAQFKLGQLERLVLFTAFQDIAAHAHQLQDIRIFINSIPSYTMSSKDWALIKEKYHHLFKKVVIEVTEAENNQPQQMKSKVELIKSLGMDLALDDFGSGYSNEVRVLSIQPDIIKIDMKMIQGIHKSPDKQTLVANLVSFCHPKGILLVAEGIEEEADLTELIRLGVDFAQGYYLGKPNFEFASIDNAITKQIIKGQYLRGQWCQPQDWC